MNTKSLSGATKIIKILKLLTENPLGINEILNEFEKEEIYINKETVSKYFATLRKSGCDLQKRKNKFFINYPILHLNENELITLAHLEKAVEMLHSKKDYDEFLKLLEKFFSIIKKEEYQSYKGIYQNIATEKQYEEISKKYKRKIEIFSNLLEDSPKRLKITFKEKEYTIIPIKLVYFKNSICIKCYDIVNNVDKIFAIDKINEVKEMPTRAANVDFGLITTFKINGRLKNAYTIREGEIITEQDDSIIVTSKNEDKEELFKRLLKYGSRCEVLYPKSDREKFKNLIERMIENQKL